MTINLEENIAPGASEGSTPQDAMETVNASLTTEATNSLGSVSIQESERDKFEDELFICNQLLDKVRGYFGFNARDTRSKAAQYVSHDDLEKSMKVNAVVAAICE